MFRKDIFFRLVLFFATITSFFIGCKPVNYLGTVNLSSTYSSVFNPAGFSCNVYNLNDSVTKATLRFPYSRLSFLPAKQGLKPVHRFKVSTLLYHSFKDNRLVDSCSVFVSDSLSHPPVFYTCNFDLKAPAGADYILQIEVHDLANDNNFVTIKTFEKTVHSNASWFRFEGEKSGFLLNNIQPENEMICLISSDKNVSKMVCKAFYDQFPPAIPPFIIRERPPFTYTYDSLFTINLTEGRSGYFKLPHEGFYFFQSDTTGKNGITLFRRYQGYPKIISPVKMIETLKYLTSSREYEGMTKQSYPKEAVDSFWVATAGGPDRAVELIRAYYTRVEEANRFFDSYCEGWKTDRGIIYIVFGTPNLIYRSDSQEIWTYGEANNYHSIRFQFLKVVNPFTDNDYILQRQSTYKDLWYNGVQQWRR